MSIAILTGRDQAEQNYLSWFSEAWKQALLALNPNLDIRIWPQIGNISEVEFVLVWNHPLGTLRQFTNAKAIYSLAAGVDHIFADKELDIRVPILRLVDPYMANDIVQYVAAYVLQYIKRIPHWAEKQKQQQWFKQPPFTFSNKKIGIMGLGHLGGQAARVLAQMGLKVNGWSQSSKNLAQITQFVGDEELSPFLSHTDILICMLPLTPKTKHILNQQTFSLLPKGALLINIGRGDHLVEADLLAALDTEHLSGAILDVFSTEPLPAKHPFWAHPKIQITPHIASVTNPVSAAAQLYENYQHVITGQVLHHQVDPHKGY